MSRIGKKPIQIPSQVKVNIDGNLVTVKGPKGSLSREIHPLAMVEANKNEIIVKRKDETRRSRSIHGLTRTLINNMVIGVSEGFSKDLIVTGVGYKVEEKGSSLTLHLGYSHPIEFPLPKGISAKVERKKEIRVTIEGYDKELVGLTAAKIRALRPPEPYKGKGIRYADEIIQRKAGKAAAK